MALAMTTDFFHRGQVANKHHRTYSTKFLIFISPKSSAMLRIYIPIAFVVVFFAWIAYRAFVTRDLRSQMTNVYAGFAFIGVWAVIYFMMLG
jgi:uncharacterized paraquat-inducible protein A